jgi:carbon-monoxide dehydrogenase medium subunit
MASNARGTFIKLALRRAQAISIIDVAIVLDITPSFRAGLEPDTVKSAAIALGAVAPTIIRIPAAESYLVGKPLTDDVFEEAARLTMESCKPIDDIRGSAAYRREMVRVCTLRGLKTVRDSQEQVGMPVEPILLWGEQDGEIRTHIAPPLPRSKRRSMERNIVSQAVTTKLYCAFCGKKLT